MLGKTIGDWSKDYRELREAHDPTQIATKTQPGPVFFISGFPIPGGDFEVDVPAGATIFHSLGVGVAWSHGLSGNRELAVSAGRAGIRPLAFEMEHLSIPRTELSQHWEEVSTPFLYRGDPNAWAAGYVLMTEPLSTGEHQLYPEERIRSR